MSFQQSDHPGRVELSDLMVESAEGGQVLYQQILAPSTRTRISRPGQHEACTHLPLSSSTGGASFPRVLSQRLRGLQPYHSSHISRLIFPSRFAYNSVLADFSPTR